MADKNKKPSSADGGNWVDGLMSPTLGTHYPGTLPVGGEESPWNYLQSNGAYDYYRNAGGPGGPPTSMGIDTAVALNHIKPNFDPETYPSDVFRTPGKPIRQADTSRVPSAPLTK